MVRKHTVDIIGKLGVGVSYSTENKWNYKTYGLSVGLGLDAIPTGVDINLNRTISSNKFLELKNIFNK